MDHDITQLFFKVEGDFGCPRDEPSARPLLHANSALTTAVKDRATPLRQHLTLTTNPQYKQGV